MAGVALHFVSVILPGTVLCAPAPVVEAGAETLRGAWVASEQGVAAFAGVPFAAAPLGKLRWRAPAPHRPRPGVQDASRFAPACMQGSGGVDWYVGVAEAFGHGPEVVGRPNGISEDCLYLNVWAPYPRAGDDLPVVVFVHGGGNSAGWSYEPNYVGSRLAGAGVVAVTIAYRLGPFGFFAHPALDDGSGAPVANFGLLDIRAAFEWVRENAAAFGGDPGELTAIGESAGALNLIDLLLADIARGEVLASPFRRLVSQSIGGSIVSRQDLAQEQAVGLRLANDMGLGPGASAADLRAVPAAEVLAAADHLPEEYYPDGVIDGRTLPKHPMAIIDEARAAGAEILLGSNAHEWLMYIDEDAGIEELEAWMAATAPGREAVLEAGVADTEDARRALDRLRTAREMLCPSRYLAEWVNATGGRAWIYRFTRQRPGPGGEKLGAYHGAELPYVFDTHDAWLPTADEDRRLTRTVMEHWLAFAAAGDPSVPGGPAWPTYSRPTPIVMELGGRAVPADSVTQGLCAVLGPASRSASGRDDEP